MKKDPIFTGAAVAIITPMHEDGSVNYDEFARFVDWQIDNGTDAIVICGTTGEASTLTDDVMGEYMLGLKTQSEEEIRRVCHD